MAEAPCHWTIACCARRGRNTVSRSGSRRPSTIYAIAARRSSSRLVLPLPRSVSNWDTAICKVRCSMPRSILRPSNAICWSINDERGNAYRGCRKNRRRGRTRSRCGVSSNSLLMTCIFCCRCVLMRSDSIVHSCWCGREESGCCSLIPTSFPPRGGLCE